MLKLEWAPGAACAPDAPQYANTQDQLTTERGQFLQHFARPGTGLPVPTPQLTGQLDNWLAGRTETTAPVPVMVHGYQYDPTNYLGGGADDPYSLVYGVPGEQYRSIGRLDYHWSWLPLVGECDDKGGNKHDTALAFSWVSEGSLGEFTKACWPHDYPYAALDLAPLAAKALATVLGHLATRSIGVRILAHSLGTRTFCQAIALLNAAGRPTAVDRAVLIGGSEYCVDAAAHFAACDFDVINLANRKDLVLSGGAETGCDRVRECGTRDALVIGREGLGANQHWLDLQLDDARVVAWFRSGYAPSGKHYLLNPEAENPSNFMQHLNHWAYYMNDGNRELLRDLILDDAMTVERLVDARVPRGVASTLYGQFNGSPIPVTPATCAERQEMTAPVTDGAGGNG